jgi:hypothetical protein
LETNTDPIILGMTIIGKFRDILTWWYKDSYKDGRKHQVIYGPDNKEHHLYDADVTYINTTAHENEYGEYTSPVNRHGNTAHLPKVKIYILTHILDQKENWCFDLNKKPFSPTYEQF